MTFPLRIYALDREVFSGNAVSLTVPGQDGEVQVLADHAPLVLALKEGTLVIEGEEQLHQEIPIEGGVLEVGEREVNCLVKF